MGIHMTAPALNMNSCFRLDEALLLATREFLLIGIDAINEIGRQVYTLRWLDTWRIRFCP